MQQEVVQALHVVWLVGLHISPQAPCHIPHSRSPVLLPGHDLYEAHQPSDHDTTMCLETPQLQFCLFFMEQSGQAQSYILKQSQRDAKNAVTHLAPHWLHAQTRVELYDDNH